MFEKRPQERCGVRSRSLSGFSASALTSTPAGRAAVGLVGGAAGHGPLCGIVAADSNYLVFDP